MRFAFALAALILGLSLSLGACSHPPEKPLCSVCDQVAADCTSWACPKCDEMGDCINCGGCASKGPCQTLYYRPCFTNAGCTAVAGCAVDCGCDRWDCPASALPCVEKCKAADPKSGALFNTWLACVGCQCPASCPALAPMCPLGSGA